MSVRGPGLVFKQTLNPQHVTELQAEFDIYGAVATHLKQATFKVPKPSKFYSSVAKLQTRYEVKLDTEGPLFSMACIPPASAPVGTLIRAHFVNERLRPQFHNLLLCRLYLGVDSTAFCAKRQRATFMNTTNYQLCSKDIEFLRAQKALPDSFTCSLIASEMGEVLAMFHHQLKLDARDIEFVLGGGGGEEEDLASLWVLDFNQVKSWKSIDDLVSAHLANDPYYPRPNSEFWSAFVAGYLGRCSQPQHLETANAFIKALTDKAKA